MSTASRATSSAERGVIKTAKLAVLADSLEVLRGRTLPRSAVYRVFAGNGDLLYVGCSSQLFTRLRQHRHQSHWWEYAAVVTFDFMARQDAILAEREAIAAEGPLWCFAGNKRYFEPDLIAAREAYGPMPRRFVTPGKTGRTIPTSVAS